MFIHIFLTSKSEYAYSYPGANHFARLLSIENFFSPYYFSPVVHSQKLRIISRNCFIYKLLPFKLWHLSAAVVCCIVHISFLKGFHLDLNNECILELFTGLGWNFGEFTIFAVYKLIFKIPTVLKCKFRISQNQAVAYLTDTMCKCLGRIEDPSKRQL